MNHTCQEFNAECAQRIGYVNLVVELGSCNVNGSVRAFYQAERYIGVDARPGREVDIVADACTWQPDTMADVVVCNNTVEHCEHPDRLIANAHRMLKDGGHLMLTMPCIGWLPHGNDGAPLPDGEYYANVSIGDMARWLKPWGDSEFSSRDGVVCVTARKGARLSDREVDLPASPIEDQRRTFVVDRASSHVGSGYTTCTDCHCLLKIDSGSTCPACLAKRPKPKPETVKAEEKPAPKTPKTTDEKPA